MIKNLEFMYINPFMPSVLINGWANSVDADQRAPEEPPLISV